MGETPDLPDSKVKRPLFLLCSEGVMKHQFVYLQNTRRAGEIVYMTIAGYLVRGIFFFTSLALFMVCVGRMVKKLQARC